MSGAAKHLSANIVSKAGALLLIPVWTSFLSPSDYGIIGTFNAYLSVMTACLLLGMHTALVRNYFSSSVREDEWKDLLFSNLNFLTLVVLSVTIALALASSFLWPRLISAEIPRIPYAMMLLAAVFFGVLGRFIQDLLIAKERHGLYAFIEIARFLIASAIGLFLVAHWKWGALGHISGWLAASIVIFVFLLVHTMPSSFRAVIKWKYVRDALKFGLPLVPHTLALTLLTCTDRIMLERFCGLHEVGLYSIAANIGLIMVFVVTAISRAWTPRFYRAMEDPERAKEEARRFAGFWFIAAGGAACALMLASPEIISLLTPSEYHRSADLAPPIIFGYFFVGLYHMGVAPLFFAKKTRAIPFLSGLAAGANVALNMIVIPIHAGYGAAMVTLICYFLLAILSFVFSAKTWWPNYPLVKFVLALAIIGSCIPLSRMLPSGTVQAIAWKGAIGISVVGFLGVLFAASLPMSLVGRKGA